MADGIASWFNVDATTGLPDYPAAALRLLQAVRAMPGSATLSRPGVRPGPGGDVTVDSSGNGSVSITAFGGTITDPAGGGSFDFVFPNTVTRGLGTRPGSGTARIDELVVVIKNTETRPGDGAREPQIVVIPGQPAAVPVAPDVPAGALKLRRLTVPASGAIALSNPPQRTTSAGGVLTVASQAEEDAISPAFDGLLIYREDTDTYRGRVNGAWQRVLLTNVGDNTPTDVAFGANWAHSSAAEKTQVERDPAGHVTLHLAAGKSSAIAAGEVICTIPTGFRPKRTVRGVGRIGGSQQFFTVNTSGTVTCDTATGAGILATIGYPAA